MDRLLDNDELERVLPSDDLADRLMSDAKAHLASAREIQLSDPPGAYQLAYDAARKACAALLAVQGLRATSSGGHAAVQEAMTEQFGPVFSSFAVLRRQRRASEYPDVDTPTLNSDDAAYGVTEAGNIVDAADRLLASGKISPFR